MERSLFQELAANLKGNIRQDPFTCKIYSVDASIYEVEPLGIIIPQNQQDLISAVRIASKHQVPVTARGAATGITGGCLGRGLIIDTAQYLTKIIEINIEEEYVICEPGVVQDVLNDALAPYGYRLGPDTSTGNRATIGGMVGNNAAGSRSLHYGRMVDHVLAVTLILPGGNAVTTRPLDKGEWERKCLQGDEEGAIYRGVEAVRIGHRDAIKAHFSKIPRHVSGYNLDALIHDFPLNLSKLIVGSEGTLGVIAEVKLAIAKKPRHTGICVIHIAEMIHSLQSVELMLKHHPSALELIDDKILSAAQNSPAVRNKLGWIRGAPQAVFVAEFIGETQQEVSDKLQLFAKDMKGLELGYACHIYQNAPEEGYIWEVRKAGLGLLLSKRSYSRAIAFIEDLSVDPGQLHAFMAEFCAYLQSVGKEAGIYGHIGSGCMHIRPYIDLRQESEAALMREIMNNVSSMVLRHGGAMSGEHGDGLIRSWLNEKMFGSEIYGAFKKIKTAFDPGHLINPGKIVDGPDLLSDLRLSPATKRATISTFLDFTEEGGFELAADLCNGNAQCRKSDSVMCPSFQATHDEYQTTRARAQSLRSVINGKTPISAYTGKEMYEVMDLCIECKGCKKECPSQIDMAKMKAEFLYQYQEKHGYFLRNRLFANLHLAYRMFSPFASVVNAIQNSRLARLLLQAVGISPHRSLPDLAKQRFSLWFAKQSQIESGGKIVLFNDTYTEFNQPDIGRAAFKILHALGYNVVLANGFCCGRPAVSKGLLEAARSNAAHVVEGLYAALDGAVAVIGLEPSCLSALRDDYKGLCGKDPLLEKKRQRVVALCQSLDEFLQGHIKEGLLPLNFKKKPLKILVHGHCHQKALVGMDPTLAVLRAVPAFSVEQIPSGCCGVAGSFGYEAEHYEMSLKIGELHLLPSVRAADPATLIVASGVSCRAQIQHGTERRAVHLAEAIAHWMLS